MSTNLETFIGRVEDFSKLPLSRQVEYFVYFLTQEENLTDGITPADVKACFITARLTPYANIPQYLSKNLKKTKQSPPKFVKVKGKYSLHREFATQLQANLKGSHLVVAAKSSLRNLRLKISDKDQQIFLIEAISCFEVGAYRAAIIMVWNLAVDHLERYILKNCLAAFNTVLAANTDKRVKVTKISTKDDFSDIPEGKFIEFCRSAKIISNDVRKILDVKLGIRNTCAHPSGVTISENKAIDVIEDLINNVVLKYPL